MPHRFAAIVGAALVAATMVAVPTASHAAVPTVISGGPVRIVSAGTIEVNGTAEPASEVKFTGLAPVAAPVIAGGDGAWSATFDLTTAPARIYTITARAAGSSALQRILVRPEGDGLTLVSPLPAATVTESEGGYVVLTAAVDGAGGGAGTTTYAAVQALSLGGVLGTTAVLDNATGLLRSKIPTRMLVNGEQTFVLWLPCDSQVGAPGCGLVSVTVEVDLTSAVQRAEVAVTSPTTDAVRATVTLQDAAPDSSLTFSVAGRAYEVTRNTDTWSAWLSPFDVVGAPSWLPASGEYPIRASGISRGKPVDVLVGTWSIDLAPRLEVIDPPTVVSAESSVQLRLRTHLVSTLRLQTDSPLSTQAGQRVDDDEDSLVTFAVGDQTGEATVVLRQAAVDGTVLSTSFPILVRPTDRQGPYVSWRDGGTGPDTSLTTFTRSTTRLRWVASDDHRIDGFEIQSRHFVSGTTSSTWSKPVRLPGTAREVSGKLRPGTTSCWRIRGVDSIGNWSGWADERCMMRAYDDSALRLRGGARRVAAGWAPDGRATTFRRHVKGRVVLPGVRTGAYLEVHGRPCGSCGTLKVRLGSGRWYSLFPPSRRGHRAQVSRRYQDGPARHPESVRIPVQDRRIHAQRLRPGPVADLTRARVQHRSVPRLRRVARAVVRLSAAYRPLGL